MIMRSHFVYGETILIVESCPVCKRQKVASGSCTQHSCWVILGSFPFFLNPLIFSALPKIYRKYSLIWKRLFSRIDLVVPFKNWLLRENCVRVTTLYV